MKLGYQTITWGGVVGQAQGVTSIKDLFYQTYGNTEQAIQDIASVGYEGIEIFDGNLAEYANKPEEFKALLATNKVTLVSVYTGANFIVGGGAQRASGIRESDYQKLATQLDRVTDLAEAAGLTACFHPHLTTIVEGPEQLAKVMKLSKIAFCPDTAHLAAGGGDPAALIRAYPDRVRHVHLKDFQKEPFAFLPLGKGDLDFKEIFAALKEINYQGWAVVELDGYNGDPKEAAAISMKMIQEHLG